MSVLVNFHKIYLNKVDITFVLYRLIYYFYCHKLFKYNLNVHLVIGF